ncbi:MAG TPA: NAD(P)/FAD-dependent oxidoreductase [Candidatus Polarisedimenticolia bacterium]|nr:NAD(P)/FAD-dependent oxidoreductase [Candidatus Polarisedimenticolia bacterium]
MANPYDAIIVGAGHNGLICAAYLAKAGRKVLVLERRNVIGGASVTEEVWPGYRVSTASYVMSMMQRKVIRDLDLPRYGWDMLPMDCLFVPFEDGRYLAMWGDTRKTQAEVAKFSKKDAEMYPVFEKFLEDAARFVRRLLFLTPPNITSRRLRDLKRMLEHANAIRKLGGKVFRIADLMTMSVAEFLDIYFESDQIKAVKAYYGSIGTFLAPRSPGTAYVLLHHLMGDLGGAGGWGYMRGGMGSVSKAIAGCAKAHGCEIRTDAEVIRIRVEDGRATGVALRSGEEIAAATVVTGADPKTTFLKLVDTKELPADFVDEIRNFRTFSTAFKINLAVETPPAYTAFNARELGIDYPSYVHIGPTMDYLERAYDDAKYGRPSERPFFTPCVPTVVDPDLAPPGKHILNIFGGHAPYELKGASWDQERDKFADRVIAELERYAPGVKRTIIHRQILMPPDLERIFALPQGHIFHGELTLDQLSMMRPAPGYADYRSPIRGLWQCGSGTHPGGGVMGMGGHNAAREILGGW